VPLDHFCDSDCDKKGTWQSKFFLDTTSFASGDPLIVHMPSEGATNGCSGGDLAQSLRALAACPQHRFFGDTVPKNDSSVANLKYLNVEQNLADVAALIGHLRSLYPSISTVISYGGSYSGASAAWMRVAYPDLVNAAIAMSPPVTARLSFSEYDTSNLVALSSPDSRCAQIVARTNVALETLLWENRPALMQLFNASYDITSELGSVDFMYGLGDSIAGAVQYGQKGGLCSAMAHLFSTRDELSNWDYAEALANFTSVSWGANFFSQCAYNSTCMRSSTSGSNAEGVRSWYWMKCTQLGYFQTAPRTGLSTRPRALTLDALLAQCKYIFGPSVPLLTDAKVDEFNKRYGGVNFGGQKQIFQIDFSDDPWKMDSNVAIVQRKLWANAMFDQPYSLITCNGCGHCGAGAPKEIRLELHSQMIAYLGSWGIHPAVRFGSAPSGGLKVRRGLQ